MQYPLPPNRLSTAAIRYRSIFRSLLSRSFSAFPTTDPVAPLEHAVPVRQSIALPSADQFVEPAPAPLLGMAHDARSRGDSCCFQPRWSGFGGRVDLRVI